MVTYEDEIEEVGEGVDHRDQEQGQQARDADLHPSTNPSISSRNGIRGDETKSDSAKAHHIVRSVGRAKPGSCFHFLPTGKQQPQEPPPWQHRRGRAARCGWTGSRRSPH
jgi:hypothetical protein